MLWACVICLHLGRPGCWYSPPTPGPALSSRESDSTCTEPVLLEMPEPLLLAEPQAPKAAAAETAEAGARALDSQLCVVSLCAAALHRRIVVPCSV